jgi:hypothetical protein
MNIYKIIASLLVGYAVILGINILWVEMNNNIKELNAFLIPMEWMIYTTFVYLFWDDKRLTELNKEKLLSDSNEEGLLIKKFENNQKIFLRVPRGFMTIPVIIQKDLGWVFEDGRYTNNEMFYNISEIREFQAEY